MSNSAIVNPVAAFAGATGAFVTAAIGASAALRNSRSAAQQAEIASRRHEEQTKADRQRRITESFSKAIEQLGNGKLEVRLGGIYSLERVSRESERDYWAVMENLSAFVRESSDRAEAERTAQSLEQQIAERAYFLWQSSGRAENRADEFWRKAVEQEESGSSPRADIAAVLTVIKRRRKQRRKRERRHRQRLDFGRSVLRNADLDRAYLEGACFNKADLRRAYLIEAHLEEADLSKASLQGARLTKAHLERADLTEARLEGADLSEASLQGADLSEAHLEGTDLSEAHLEGTDLSEAHLEGTDLRGTVGLSETQLIHAFGDGSTQLPEAIKPPQHWPRLDRTLTDRRDETVTRVNEAKRDVLHS